MEVLASLEVGGRPTERVLGPARNSLEDAALLIHQPVALSLRFGGPLEVALLDDQLVVLARRELGPLRPVAVARGCRVVLFAERGAFDRWRLQVGDRLEVSA
jgi:hypothetical protein